jgi:hypothetical protein
MKFKYNVNPLDPTTILRLISELEGVYNFLLCLDDTEEEIEYIEKMKKKYYKLYFKMKKTWSEE